MCSAITKELLNHIGEDKLVRILNENPSARGVLLGYSAEYELMDYLEKLPGVLSIKKIPDSHKQKGDIAIVLEDGLQYFIEVKVFHARSIRVDKKDGSVRGRVSVKSSDSKIIEGTTSRTTSMFHGQFDILAIAYWDTENNLCKFWFMKEKHIPFSPSVPDRMASSFNVNTKTSKFLHDNIFQAIFEIS